MKPFLRWAGGKQNLIKDLLKYLPPSDQVGRYFEPFLGAGSLFFATDYKKCFLSDINKDLMNCYRAIKNEPILIATCLERHNANFQKDEQYYYKVRERFNENLEEKSLKQAARFIFLIHTSFNGIYRVNKQGKYNVPIGKRKPALPSNKYLIQISEKLKGNHLSKGSFKVILNKTLRGDFIYLDPPYPPINGTSFFQHYTKDKFPQKEQAEVAEFAEKLNQKGCFVMISNANTSMLQELYRNWNKYEIETTRYISCKSKRIKVNELIITNY
ncbi:MAG: Dam family site-specific DNA-(adenine-N6)-methyltransferase [Candidatus Stygibacter frigidus]|nr:Dam family site-specific DNA-(adenine-N6)-methyltransferase [Candidatus Stygibacter frigidus]